jgi:caspase domain-containing protein
MRTRIILAAIGILLFADTNALAADKVALVIGNSTYSYAARLSNPANDASAIGQLLDAAGFQVDIRNDLDWKGMRRAILEFSGRTRDADVAVVFYAGHGMEVDDHNYLIPTDAELKTDQDIQYEAIPLTHILDVVQSARRLRVVILDACRDNPFVAKMTRSVASRNWARGLARVDATANTLIAFAARAGATAADNDGEHSPFTNALIKHLTVPGRDVGMAFRMVRDEVLASTRQQQEPYLSMSLGGAEIALVEAEKQAGVALPIISPNDEARRDFDYAMKVGTKEAWEAFLAAHPTGFYANLGHGELAKRLTAAAQGKVAPPSAAEPALAKAARDQKLDQKTASRHEPEIRTRSLTRHETEKPAAQKKERAVRSGSRSGGGGACGYVRRAVRAGSAAGLDNGHGLIAFGRSICGS